MRMRSSTRLAVMVLFMASAIAAPARPDSTALEYLNNILKGNEQNIDKNLKRLSGGVRLLSDDPANYAIYQRLEAHIRGLGKQIDNVTQLIAYYNYVEALLDNMTDVLQRIRELIIMKSNSIYAPEDTDLINFEIDRGYENILYLLKTSQFNRKTVFADLYADELFIQHFKKDAYYKLENVDAILDFILTQRTFYGTKVNQLEHRRQAQMLERENAEDFQSTILDVDYGSEISLLQQNQLLFLINILLLDVK